MTEFLHKTVLLHELTDALSQAKTGLIVDCTAGGGGHTAELLNKKVGEHVLAIDQDPVAIHHLEKKFEKELAIGAVSLDQSSFSQLKNVVAKKQLPVTGIIADLGVSSPQLDHAERGFSFQKDGPLDMRMSDQGPTAADLLQTADYQTLKDILWTYGEEPQASRITNAIIRTREQDPLVSTLQLANLVAKTVSYKQRSKKHPATKTFQAIRIWVNKELEVLETLLKDGFELLAPNGIMAIISFHSLEDRCIKQFMKSKCTAKPLPRGLPILERDTPRLPGQIIKPFPIVPKQVEMERTPRARSAKLRVFKKNP